MILRDEESKDRYQTIAVHTGRIEEQGVATLLNKKIVQEFIVPAYNAFKGRATTLYLQAHFPNQLPDFTYFSVKKNPDYARYIKHLHRMYKHYGVLDIAKLEARGLLTTVRREDGQIYPITKLQLALSEVYGQVENHELQGIGRRIDLDSRIVEEGQFVGNELDGFGRQLKSDGHYAMGHWQCGRLHGYAMKVTK